MIIGGGQKAQRNQKHAQNADHHIGISQEKMKLIKKKGRKLNTKSGNYLYLFHCDFCGANVEKHYTSGKRDNSCGCNKTEHLIKHGGNGTKLHSAWKGMKQRCLNKNHKAYKYYGGRGIKICEEWLDFSNFREWANKSHYKYGLQIDRIDNDGNYEPSNCRFISAAENMKNSKASKLNWSQVFEIRDLYKKGVTIRCLSGEFNVCYTTIHQIVKKHKWIPDEYTPTNIKTKGRKCRIKVK